MKRALARFAIFVASMTLLVAAAPVSAQLDGTLFTTPAERTYMDYLRQEFLARNLEAGFNIETPEIPEIPSDQIADEPPDPLVFALGGIMTSRDGSRSVWLNEQLLDENSLPNGISIAAGTAAQSLLIRHSGVTYTLRPGQAVNLTTGEVLEAYQRMPPAPEPGGPDISSPVGAADAAVLAAEPSADAAAIADISADAGAGMAEQLDSDADVDSATDGETLSGLVSELSDEQLIQLIETLQAAQQEDADAVDGEL